MIPCSLLVFAWAKWHCTEVIVVCCKGGGTSILGMYLGYSGNEKKSILAPQTCLMKFLIAWHCSTLGDAEIAVKWGAQWEQLDKQLQLGNKHWHRYLLLLLVYFQGTELKTFKAVAPHAWTGTEFEMFVPGFWGVQIWLQDVEWEGISALDDNCGLNQQF